MLKIDKLFKRKCQMCAESYDKTFSDKIKLKTQDGIVKLKICPECANTLEQMKLKDIQ
jgi:hypothetical protein